MGERDDELLSDIDPSDEPPGAFEGYRAGLRSRRALYGTVVGVVTIGVIAGIWYARKMEAWHRTPAHARYELSESDADASASRPRELVWSAGRARLGLSRTDPGVTTLLLPDQRISLAEGCDHAQVKVDVRDGVTVDVQVLVGEVVSTPIGAGP